MVSPDLYHHRLYHRSKEKCSCFTSSASYRSDPLQHAGDDHLRGDRYYLHGDFFDLSITPQIAVNLVSSHAGRQIRYQSCLGVRSILSWYSLVGRYARPSKGRLIWTSLVHTLTLLGSSQNSPLSLPQCRQRYDQLGSPIGSHWDGRSLTGKTLSTRKSWSARKDILSSAWWPL